MENASKALIIAGAILLSILLISLGLVVYNQASDQIGNANLDQQQIEAFNSKFTPYQGANVSAAQVNALRQLVISVNGSEKSNGTYQYVEMTYDGSEWVSIDSGNRGEESATTQVAATSGAVRGKTYTVTLTNDSTGLVSVVAVKTNT